MIEIKAGRNAHKIGIQDIIDANINDIWEVVGDFRWGGSYERATLFSRDKDHAELIIESTSWDYIDEKWTTTKIVKIKL